MTTADRQADDELRRGWLLILSACAGVICSSIVLPYYSIGALVVPVTEEFGWTRAQFQAAILFSAGVGALIAPLVGVLGDRFGSRALALPGLVGLSLGFLIAASMNGQLWMLYFAYGGMALLGAGTIPVTWTKAITTNFFRRRGLALGLTLTGTGICASIVPHYAVWLVDAYGWRTAYVGLAMLPLLFAGPIVFIGFRPREDLAPVAAGEKANKERHQLQWGLTLGEAVRGYRFWVMMLSVLTVYMAFSGISPNLIPALTDEGFSSSEAASVLSVFGVSIIIGRVAVGYLVDRFWAPGVAMVAMLLPVAGCLLLIGVQSITIAAVAAFLIGFAAGAELDLMSFLAARYFGLQHYAKIYSILYASLAVCSGTAPMLFARVYDVTDNYDFGFYVAAGLFALGALIILTLGPYPKAEEDPGAEGVST
jgi:predicted MFS family arabinose efflux permease